MRQGAYKLARRSRSVWGAAGAFQASPRGLPRVETTPDGRLQAALEGPEERGLGWEPDESL